MNDLAWEILSIFIQQAITVYNGDFARGYIAAWSLGQQLGGDATSINSVDVRIKPRNEIETALRILLDMGLIEDVPNLGERFRLVVTRTPQVAEEVFNFEAAFARLERLETSYRKNFGTIPPLAVKMRAMKDE